MTDSSIGYLWLALDRARHAPRSGESILDRLRQDPWSHDDPAVRSAWEVLTRPENLVGLEQWERGDLNPVARRMTDAAIHESKTRNGNA
jgi:hypothetical protein